MGIGLQPMAAMMSIQNLFIYAIRYGYPYLIPFIVAEYNLPEQARATLLSAFTPGYILAQIPGGLVAGRVGGKAVMTWISYGMVTAVALLPAAASRSANLAAVCLAAVGIAQAPMRPAQVKMTYNWVPHGPSRAYYMMIISLGSGAILQHFTP
jgi:sugar phosphate permease